MPVWFDSIVVLLVVLVVARYIKRGSKTLKRYFIPSALIAGFGALILGPQVLGAIPKEIATQWSGYPKFLINVVFAGLFIGQMTPGPKEIWKKAGPMIAFGNTLAWGQYVIGILATMLFLGPVFGAPALTGALMEISFEGGHGTAVGLRPTLTALGSPESADIALGLATLSIVTAIFSGLLIINWYQRKHHKILDEVALEAQQKRMIRNGYSLTKFVGRFETNPKEFIINVLLFAVAILIGLAMHRGLIGLENTILGEYTHLRFFKYLPLFPMAMLGGLIIQFFLKLIHKTHIIRRRTTKAISSIALDLLILSAIATVSLNSISSNFPVFITLAVLGVAWILGAFFFLAPRFFKRNWFENGMTNTGQSMGMTATGLLMNRLADPSNHTGARESFAYKQLAFEPFMGGGIITAMAAVMLHEFGQLPVLIVCSVVFIFWVIFGLYLGSHWKYSKKSLRQRLIGRLAMTKDN